MTHDSVAHSATSSATANGAAPGASCTIRRLGAADAAAYRALRLRGLREHPDAFTSSFDEEAAKPLETIARRIAEGSLDTVWGAFAGDTLAGVIGLGREPRAKGQHKALVFGMYVAPEHRHRGVGRALLARLIAEARGLKALEQLVLTVTDGNVAAQRLYESAGFRSFGVEPRAIRVGAEYFAKNHMILFLRTP